MNRKCTNAYQHPHHGGYASLSECCLSNGFDPPRASDAWGGWTSCPVVDVCPGVPGPATGNVSACSVSCLLS